MFCATLNSLPEPWGQVTTTSLAQHDYAVTHYPVFSAPPDAGIVETAALLAKNRKNNQN